MRHLGDVCKINGAEIEPVDVITFGSPCQDLSVAGHRKGMKHQSKGDEETTRSGLFLEAIRIIKEMREADVNAGRTGIHVRPRYAIYENVPGAFSSNGGRDFQTVLTEIIRIAEPKAPDVEMPDGGGKWPNSGCYYSDMGRWSIAYRTVDAQYWGTPQRRKRIALLADFNGMSAPDILFDAQYRGEAEDEEPDDAFGSADESDGHQVSPVTTGLPRNPESCGEAGEGTSAGTERGAGTTARVKVFDARGNGTGTISPTLTGDHQNRITDYTAIGVEISTDGEEAL